MAYTTPFHPAGGVNTQLITVTTTPFAAVNNTGSGDARIVASSTIPVYFAIGTSVGSSSLTATLPTSGTPTNSFPMIAGGVGGAVEKFSFGPNYWLTAMTSAPVTAYIVITAGTGS